MPIFITHGRYTAAAVKGMVEHSQDRAKAVADLFERAGGKLLGFYITFGDMYWSRFAEVPDAETNLAVLLAGISKETGERCQDNAGAHHRGVAARSSTTPPEVGVSSSRLPGADGST